MSKTPVRQWPRGNAKTRKVEGPTSLNLSRRSICVKSAVYRVHRVHRGRFGGRRADPPATQLTRRYGVSEPTLYPGSARPHAPGQTRSRPPPVPPGAGPPEQQRLLRHRAGQIPLGQRPVCDRLDRRRHRRRPGRVRAALRADWQRRPTTQRCCRSWPSSSTRRTARNGAAASSCRAKRRLRLK
jgi:hypothetical protein